MTLKIKPVILNKSVYIRVPNDIADLLGIDKDVELELTLETSGNNVSLVYSVKGTKIEVSQPMREIMQRISQKSERQIYP